MNAIVGEKTKVNPMLKVPMYAHASITRRVLCSFTSAVGSRRVFNPFNIAFPFYSDLDRRFGAQNEK